MTTFIILSSTNYNAYALTLYKSNEQLFNESNIVVVGAVTSAHEILNGTRTEYTIQPQEYLKPTSFDTTRQITAWGVGSKSFDPYARTYQVGDRALFFLQKEDEGYFISMYSIWTLSDCSGSQLLALSYSPGDFAIAQGNNTYEKMFAGEPINITGYAHNHADLKSRDVEIDFTVHTPTDHPILAEKRQIHLEHCKGFGEASWSFVPTIPGKYSVNVNAQDANGSEFGGGSFCCITVIDRNGSSNVPSAKPTQQTYQTSVRVEIPNGSSQVGCDTTNSCFIPYQVMIKTGGQVTWYNNDTVFHTVTSGRPTDDLTGTAFDSNVIPPGKTFSYTFSNHGNFTYFDQLHPWMTGIIDVVGNGTVSKPSLVTTMVSTLPTPLQQYKSGIDPYKTKCEKDLVLVIAFDNSPACVKTTSLYRLWYGGWINSSPAIYLKFSNPYVVTKFQSKIISKDLAIEIIQNYIKEHNLNLNVDTNSSTFKIVTSLNYELLGTGYNYLLDVNPNTGFPMRVFAPSQMMAPGWPDYYDNPQWWFEFEKSYVGMENNRIENGTLAWHVDYRECPNCIAPYPMFMVDAITGKVILAYTGFNQ